FSLSGNQLLTAASLFSLSGNQLLTAASFNFETKSSYSIRLRSTDQSGQWVEQVFSITITNVNEAPLDLGYFGASKPENSPIGTQFGFFFGVDLDAGSVMSFALVDGPGGEDNDLFYFDGNLLRNSALLDYEQKSAYNIRVLVADQGGLFIEKPFVFTITNVNEPPTEILLSNSEVPENSPSGTVVGNFTTIDQDGAGTFTYSLVSGTGSTDNASFTLINGVLRTAFIPDFEVKSSYSIRVRTTDSTGLSLTKVFTISVANVNEPPFDIILSNDSIQENNPVGLEIGTFSTSDFDLEESFTYELVEGAGGGDNAFFTLNGNSLQAAASFSYEARSSYSIRVRSTDHGGLLVEKSFTITISDLDEAPTSISLSNDSVIEKQPIGTFVATLSTSDPDGESPFTYELIGGVGSDGNGSFAIVGDSLMTAEVFDFAVAGSYDIRVRSTDPTGLMIEMTFTILIVDINDAPILNPAGSPTFDTIRRGVTDVENPGTLVTDLIARMSPEGGITDVDLTAQVGIAINGLSGTATGVWQFTIDGGSTWSPVGTTGNSNARLLAADGVTRIRYVPDPDFWGEVKISFVAWDRTSGVNGGNANVSVRGGSTAFSLSYDYADLFFLNESPILNPDGRPEFTPIQQNVSDSENPGDLVSGILARMSPDGGIADPNGDPLLGISIFELTGVDTGDWEYSVNDGANWYPIGVVTPSAARLLASDQNTRIRYRPHPDFSGLASITFLAWDRSVGLNGETEDVTMRGGTSAFSLESEIAQIHVLSNSATQVNTYTTGTQRMPILASDADGNYVIVWESDSQDGSSSGIYARLYDRQGSPRGNEFRVNSWTTSGQIDPAVVMHENGEFVVSWTAANGPGGSETDIYARRFDFNGVPLTDDFLVNTTTTSSQYESAISMDADGNFVVVWSSFQQSGIPYGWWDVYGRRFNSDGIPVGDEFQINTHLTYDQRYPSVAMDEDGDFVVVWTSYSQSPDPYYNGGADIYGRRFDSSGAPQNEEFLVSEYVDGAQFYPSVVVNAQGDFIVGWRYSYYGYGDPSYFLRRYNSDGTSIGTDFEVRLQRSVLNYADPVRIPKLQMRDNGDFLVVDSNFAQWFKADGTLWGDEFEIDVFNGSNFEPPAVEILTDGSLIATWGSKDSDGDSWGVFSRRIAPQVIPPNHAPVLNGSGVLALEGISENPSSANNPGIPITDLIAKLGIGVSDSDPMARLGIAVNGVSNVNGHWEFTTNRGGTWTPITTTGNSDAILLAADGSTRIRFKPNANYLGQSVFSFVIWDRTSGANGQRADVSTRGGSTAFSSNYRTASTSVVPSPRLDPIPVNVSIEDNPGFLVSDLLARTSTNGNIGFLNQTTFRAIAIIGFNGQSTGYWEYYDPYSHGWYSFIWAESSYALALSAVDATRIRYRPNPGFSGEVKFAFVGYASGATGSRVNASTRGPGTSFSLLYEYASLSVVNSAPVLNPNGNPTLDPITINIPDANNPGTLVSDIIARMSPNGGITDPNPNALQGIAINGLGGTATGIWEYTVNNGTNWTPIGTTGNNNARLLAADPNTRIRYRPNAGFLGEAKLAFVAWDRTTGANGGIANVNNRGGTTAYSIAYEYASIFVVNSPPILTPTNASYLDSIPANISNAANVGTLISDLITRIGPNGITDPNP
ncbi:MAG: cadherin repeat domain-containing protein, partial [Planctomycetaceae bacterium]|nr:cadherin repeat domain-containing protein [Planctomycetaceae bacterium]